MYKICKTEKTAARQKSIENALFELMRKKAYENITITELCAFLSMPRKAFYRYFDSKESALKALIEHTMAEFGKIGQRERDGMRSLQLEIEDFFVFWIEHREFLDVLSKSNLQGMVMQAAISFPINNMVSLSRILPDDDEKSRIAIFRFAISGLMSTMFEWYRDGFKTSVRDMARLAVRILSKPPFPNLDKLGISDLPI